jgi:hypothetical protein
MKLSSLSRREFLRAAGVCLALPTFEGMLSAAPAAARSGGRRRMVAINHSLGIHGPFFFPKEQERGYELPPYLKVLEDFRDDFTVFSGISHPEVDGGHSSESSYLTAVPHPGYPNYRNSVSLDQLVAERYSGENRFDSLILSTAGGRSLSWTRNGVMLQASCRPAEVFKRLFLEGSKKEVDAQVYRLRKGKSIMDTVRGRAQELEKSLGGHDRDKLDEYTTAVRSCEKKLLNAQEWIKRPKPKVDVAPPMDIADHADMIGRARLMYDLIHLALQTESTRAVTLVVEGIGEVPTGIPVDLGHHALSHHGLDPKRIEGLQRIELELMRAFRDFLTKLKNTKEEGETLLDRTMILTGSSLGNASSHDTHNLPMLLAGGGFRHGRHLAFDTKKNAPLSNVFVSMLQQLGLEIDKFGTSTGTLRGLEPKANG